MEGRSSYLSKFAREVAEQELEEGLGGYGSLRRGVSESALLEKENFSHNLPSNSLTSLEGGDWPWLSPQSFRFILDGKEGMWKESTPVSIY